MAAKRYSEEARPEKAKVRVLYTEVEGSNESIQEALKAMVAAMRGPVQVVQAPARIPGNGGAQSALSAPENGSETEEVVETADDNASAEENDANSASRRARGTGPKKDRNAGIELVPNLDFVPDGKQSLKAFFGEKKPKTDMENILVVSFYMRHIMELSGIGLGHVRTALKHVGVAIPVDLKQTIRNMKKDKNWLDFSSLDDIRVATEGENEVEHEMGNGVE